MAQPAFAAPTATSALPRLFVALELSTAVRSAVEHLLQDGRIPGAKWTPPASWHVTLHFIGASELASVRAALGTVRASSFTTKLSGVGTFGKSDRPRVLWAGAPRSQELLALHASVGDAIRGAGFQTNDREYAPHVTLAKFGKIYKESLDTLDRFLSENASFETEAFRAERFTLFESIANSSGPVYEPRAHFALD